jgi:membrane associated rhomboid family serine protease
MPTEPYAFLHESLNIEEATAVRHALTDARIPYRTGAHGGGDTWVVFFVPWRRIQEAQSVIAAHTGIPAEPSAADFELDEDEPRRSAAGPARFPWGAVQAVAGMVLLHAGLVFVARLPDAPVPLLRMGGIMHGAMLEEPWRLLTAMFLHVDLRHALWNGVSMLVFAVPLITFLGYRHAAMIYLVAGIGGGISAALFSTPGTLTVGSSGAVAGLFGAWVVLTLRRARQSGIGWRPRVRTMGIALLVLPSLISPYTASGQPISVSSHLGGLLTGMLIGALISGRLLGRLDGLRFDES